MEHLCEENGDCHNPCMDHEGSVRGWKTAGQNTSRKLIKSNPDNLGCLNHNFSLYELKSKLTSFVLDGRYASRPNLCLPKSHQSPAVFQCVVGYLVLTRFQQVIGALKVDRSDTKLAACEVVPVWIDSGGVSSVSAVENYPKDKLEIRVTLNLSTRQTVLLV